MALCCTFAGLAPQAAGAQAADAFTVRNVAVDVTGQNANAAREQALAEGQRLAFRRLLERLTDPSSHARLPQTTNDQIIEMVRDLAIEHEKSSSVRYIASLSVRFKPDAVRRLLRDANIAYAETRSRAVLLLPVHVAGGRAVLWEDPNPWRTVWAGRAASGLVPVVVPFGELADVTAIDVDGATAGDIEGMAAIGERYGTSDVMVAVAEVKPGGDARPEVDVRLLVNGPSVPRPWDAQTFTATETETLETLLKRSAEETAAAIDEAYRSENLLQFNRAASLSAVVPIQGMADWMAVRERLGRVAAVRGYELVSISRGEAAVILHFVGDQQQLEATLAQNGLPLAWGNGLWIMQPPGKAAAGTR